MDVAFRFVGHVKVDHMSDSVDVDSPRRQIRRHQDLNLLAAKSIECSLPGILRLVAMNCGRIDAVSAQLVGQQIGTSFGLCEDQRLSDGAAVEDFEQNRSFLMAFDKQHLLIDQFHRG